MVQNERLRFRSKQTLIDNGVQQKNNYVWKNERLQITLIAIGEGVATLLYVRL